MIKKTNILDRVISHYQLKGKAELASFLGITPQAVSNWYSRETIDYDLIFTKCEGVDLNWLLTGKGRENISETKSIENAYNRNVGELVGQNVGKRKVKKTPTIEAEVVAFVNDTPGAYIPATGKDMHPIPVYRRTGSMSASAMLGGRAGAIDYVALPGLTMCDGAIEMGGKDMEPEIKAGDFVVYRIRDLRKGVRFGRLYLLAIELEPGEEEIFIQYVDPGDDEQHVRLDGPGRKHAFDVPLNAIRTLAEVKATFRYAGM